MHNACMTVITIRDVSDEDNRRLKEQAERRGQSLQRFLAEELHAIANRTPLEQALEGALAGLEPVDVKADTIIAVLRDSREVDAS